MTFEEVFTYEHLFKAAKESCNGVRWKHSTQMFELRMSQWVAGLYDDLYSGRYKSRGFTEFDICERGKTRHIQAVHISERCVQKCLCQYFLKPLIQPKLIYDNSANIKGKGTHFALKRLKQQLAKHYKKYGRQGGVLIVDYHDFFASIPHDNLLAMLREDIEDERLYELTAMFVDCFSGKRGLGLGSEISQILAVYYPNKIDHYVKEMLHIKGYGRYMDDSILIHEDIEYLKYCRDVIRDMSTEMGLTLNEKRTRIVKLTDSFEYLKKRISITESGKIVMKLTRANITKRRRTLKKQAAGNVDASTSYTCWRGYAKHCDSYKTVQNMDKLYSELFEKGVEDVNGQRKSRSDEDDRRGKKRAS